ncbi:MAG TPA: energy transducer TonB [Pyrinomonadaceae bacterium]
MNRLQFLLATLVFGISHMTAQTTHEYLLRGTVKTPADEIVAGLTLCSGDSWTSCASTDLNGEFQMRLKPGEYDLTASKFDAPDFRLHVNITDGPLNPDNLTIVLDPGRFCCRTPNGSGFPTPISIPKSSYPPAARAVRATGEVFIAVEIDKGGHVTSANSMSGNPLLRRAAEIAAKGALFEPSDSVPIRPAVLAYVFLPSKEQREGIRKYSNPFRIEIIDNSMVIDTVNADPGS